MLHKPRLTSADIARRFQSSSTSPAHA
jgi:hypothetical protein